MGAEVIYPRISAIWFGNILEIWATDLSVSLLVMAIGYRLGALILQKGNRSILKLLVIIYSISAVWFFLLPGIYRPVLDSFLNMPVVLGAFLFALLFMAPTVGLLAVTGPLLVQFANQSKGFGVSLIYGASSLCGAIGVLLTGLYFLPHLGISISCYAQGALLAFSAALLLTGFRS
jgi:hypothetical protein